MSGGENSAPVSDLTRMVRERQKGVYDWSEMDRILDTGIGTRQAIEDALLDLR